MANPIAYYVLDVGAKLPGGRDDISQRDARQEAERREATVWSSVDGGVTSGGRHLGCTVGEDRMGPTRRVTEGGRVGLSLLVDGERQRQRLRLQ